MHTIDIIIVNHNSSDCAAESIKSIKRTINGFSANIVVVDNASEDHPERLEQLFPDIRLLLVKENLGYSRAINMALKTCGRPYVVIMNPDTIVLKGVFSNILEYLDKNKNVGVVGPKIIDPDGSIQGSARKFPTAWTYAFGRKSPLTRIFPENAITKKEFVCFDCNGDQEITVDWVSGAFMVVRREAFEAVGGFDERFFLYWEDTDLCKRIKEAGWQVVYYPKAEIKHMVGVSSKKSPIKSICHFHHSCYKLFDKHSKSSIKILAPSVLIALALRCAFVILLNVISRNISCRGYKLDKMNTQEKNRTKSNKENKALGILSRRFNVSVTNCFERNPLIEVCDATYSSLKNYLAKR